MITIETERSEKLVGHLVADLPGTVLARSQGRLDFAHVRRHVEVDLGDVQGVMILGRSRVDLIRSNFSNGVLVLRFIKFELDIC